MNEKVTHAQARAILRRFNASHWGNPGEEYARYSIPARPEDDDLTLARYIDQNEARDLAQGDE